MQLKILRSADELPPLELEWNQLPLPSPMQSHQWLGAWWEVYGQQQRGLYVVAAHVDGRLVGLAPLYLDARGDLHWLGDGQVCSDHASLLVVEGYRQEFAAQLASLLMQNGDGDSLAAWRNIVLDSTNTQSVETQTLSKALTVHGGFRSDHIEVGSCYIDLPSTWEDYLSSISKNHRKRCRRWLKTYFDSGRATIEVATTPDACLAAWDTLVQLHNARRNNLGHRGVFEDEQFTEFHRRVIPRLAAANMIQLRLLTVDQETVAAEYLLCHDNTWFTYQSGLSEAGEAISAGNLSIVALMHDAVAENCRRVDLLRGVEPYKFSWGAVLCPASTITVRRPTITGRLATLRDSVWAAAREAKRRHADQRQIAPASSS